MRHAPIGTLALAVGAAAAPASLVSGTAVIMSGDLIGGRSVQVIGPPSVTASGQIGYYAKLSDGTHSIMLGATEIFNSGSVTTHTLAQGGVFASFSDAGGFAYDVHNNDLPLPESRAVWSDSGPVAQHGDAAPGSSSAAFQTNMGGSWMAADGTIYWSARIDEGSGTSNNSAIYRRATDGTVSRVLGTGDVIDGSTVYFTNAGMRTSDNNAHRTFQFTELVGGDSKSTIAVDNAVVAQAQAAAGSLGTWGNLERHTVNNDGTYLISGTVHDGTVNRNVINANGNIALKTGDVVDGLTLAGINQAGIINAIGLNNLGEAFFVWDTDEETETLFYAPDASNLAGAIKIASVGDEIDLDNDGVADWLLGGFGLGELTEGGQLTISTALTTFDGFETHGAIITYQVPAPATAGLLALGALASTRRRR